MQQLPFADLPEDAGVSSQAVMNYLDARERDSLQVHSLWVLRHGKVACRLNFAPYDDQTPHMLFSLSKSFCSAAAGFAVQEGLLRWDTRLIDVLPDKFPPEPDERLCAITLHDLLIMGSGLRPESDSADGEDWAKAVLACGCDHDPGTHFHYNSHGTYLISCMVQRVTGLTCRDYLIPRLFEPLGMMNPDGTPPEWDCCPQGVNVGGWGLWLSCAQIARFGQCLLQKGVWDGRQVLPPEWLARATVSQIDNTNGMGPWPDNSWGAGYGYQFWRCPGDRYRGDGMFSQFCIVDEKRDMVVCCVSGQADIGKALDAIYAHLFDEADLPPADVKTQKLLKARLMALCWGWPSSDPERIGPRPEGVWEGSDITLTLDGEGLHLALKEETFVFPWGRRGVKGERPAACGAWDNEVSFLMRYVKGPFTLKGTVRFAGDEAELTLGGVGQTDATLRLTRRKD